jgi:hypothetical protein
LECGVDRLARNGSGRRIVRKEQTRNNTIELCGGGCHDPLKKLTRIDDREKAQQQV